MIQININPGRRQEIKKIVYETLCNYSVPFIPLKIKSLVRSFSNIRLIPYSKQMKRMNLSYSQMIRFANTMDACTDYYVDNDLYIIYYNDIEKSITLSNRYRWNIAHELGHIMLKHQKTHIKTRIFRNELSNSEYNEVEAEADYFAQLILVPHVVLYAFKISSELQLKEFCQISGPAAFHRFQDYKQWAKQINGTDNYDKPLFYYYYNFIYKKHCQTCDSYVIQKSGKYCPICGQKTLKWGDGDIMKYPLLETYENGKLKECPNCHNEETSIDGEFCQICGKSLINTCTNSDCGFSPLPSNARYCPLCGCHSSFYKSKLLKDWNYKEPPSLNFEDMLKTIPDAIEDEIDEELPFN